MDERDGKVKVWYDDDKGWAGSLSQWGSGSLKSAAREKGVCIK